MKTIARCVFCLTKKNRINTLDLISELRFKEDNGYDRFLSDFGMLEDIKNNIGQIAYGSYKRLLVVWGCNGGFSSIDYSAIAAYNSPF